MTRSTRPAGAAPKRQLFNSNRYAAVTSTMALIIALGGGTAYAAGLITSKDIKDGGVKRIDIANGAITSNKIADGSLLKGDFKAGQLPVGSPGPAGPQGPAGQPGASGPVDLVYVRTGPLGADPGVTQVLLFCPEGLSPTGGGLASTGSDTLVQMHSSFPFDDDMLGGSTDPDTIPDDGWGVEINNDDVITANFAAYAVCGSATRVAQAVATVGPAGVTTQRTTGGERIVARPDSNTTPGN